MYNNSSIIIDNKNVKSRDLLVFLETKIEGVRTFKGMNCQPPKDENFSGFEIPLVLHPLRKKLLGDHNPNRYLQPSPPPAAAIRTS